MKKLHFLLCIAISLVSFKCIGQQSLIPYAGEYRAGLLRYKQIYNPSDYNEDPNTYPTKKIDYQIIIDPNTRMIKYMNNETKEQWQYFKLVGNPKFERFLDDAGGEILMTRKIKARDNYGEYCEVALAIYKTEGSYRLAVDYPNKMFYSYDFAKASEWDQFTW